MILSIRGAHYHIDVKGSGLPTLFLHGFTGDTTTWHETINLLAQKGQCIAIDLPGHGKTAVPLNQQRFTVEETCKDIDLILTALNLDRVNLVGYSMGGRVALSFAIMYSERVNKLVLESASPGLDQEEERQHRISNDEELARFIEQQGIVAFVDRWENIPMFSSQKYLPSITKEKIRNQRLKNDPIGLATNLRELGTGAQPSWWDYLVDLKCETLLLIGKEDPKFNKIADQMNIRMPFAKKVVLSGAGHAIHVEQPQKFGTIVREFLF